MRESPDEEFQSLWTLTSAPVAIPFNLLKSLELMRPSELPSAFEYVVFVAAIVSVPELFVTLTFEPAVRVTFSKVFPELLPINN